MRSVTIFAVIFAVLNSVVLLMSPAAQADTSLTVEVEIPRLSVAEYHRPYIAIWVSDPNQQRVSDIEVWYDTAMANQEGHKWLPDLRQWWRRSGRQLDLPVDGVSGATRAPGNHSINVRESALQVLEHGDYILHIEAAREVGGREHLRLPFSWPADAGLLQEQQGEHELGRVRLHAH